ncbi:hypothetical protein HNR34_001761 [Geobacillus subterraneus]
MHTSYQQEKRIRPIRMVVIYKSDVTSVRQQLNAGDVFLSSKAVLLGEFNGDAIFHAIEEKIHNGEPLTPGETMKLIPVPLMHARFDRQTMIEKNDRTGENDRRGTETAAHHRRCVDSYGQVY